MAIVMYYIALTITTLSIAIFNLSVSTDGKNLQCFSITLMDIATYQANLNELTTKINTALANAGNGSSIIPPTTTTLVNNITYYQVATQSGNSYKSISTIIGVIYLIIMFLALFLVVILFWLSDLVPNDFINMGFLKRGAAILTKVFPPLIVLLHWIVFLLIIILWILVGSQSCIKSEPTDTKIPIGNDVYAYHNLVTNLQIVNIIIVILLHYGFAILKDMLYIEPFMYAPKVGERTVCKDIIDISLKTLGP